MFSIYINMVDNTDKYNVKKLKSVLTSYNKSVRKMTYKGVAKMKKAEVIQTIRNDFIQTTKNNGKQTQFKHKNKRFTKKIPHDR